MEARAFYALPGFEDLISLVWGRPQRTEIATKREVQELPDEVWCQIAKSVRTLPEILRLLRTEKRFRGIILDCVEEIRADPNYPDRLIPAPFVLAFRHLRKVDSDIYVNTQEDLVDLAHSPIKYYRLILGPIFGNNLNPDTIKTLIYTLDNFIIELGDKPVEYLSFRLYFQRPGATLAGRLFRQLNVPQPVLFLLDRHRLDLDKSFYEQEILNDTYHLFQTLAPRVAILEAPLTTAFELTPPLNKLNDFLDYLALFPRLQQINVINSGFPVLAYLQYLPRAPTVTRLNTAISAVSQFITKRLYSITAEVLERATQEMISQNIRSEKPVEIDLPFDWKTIPSLLQVFPNLRSVGLFEPINVREILNTYPELHFTIFTANPERYSLLKMDLEDQVTVEVY